MLFLLMHVSKVHKFGDHHIRRAPGTPENLSASRITSQAPSNFSLAQMSTHCSILSPAQLAESGGGSMGRRGNPQATSHKCGLLGQGADMRQVFNHQVLTAKVDTEYA